MEYEYGSDTNYIWCTWDIAHRIGKGTGRHGNERTSRNHPDRKIMKIGQNTEKSPTGREETCCHSNSSEKLPANSE